MSSLMVVHSQDDGVKDQNGVSINGVVPVRNENIPPIFFKLSYLASALILVFLGNLPRLAAFK
jgi:hypothetical protein